MSQVKEVFIPDAEVGQVSSRGKFIWTFTGERFYPTDPKGREMNIEDIAHSLAHSCRFTGHTSGFYSVAEHCVRMTKEASSEREAYNCLMHDCSEAYLVDLPRPLKAVPQFGARYKTMEEEIMEIAAKRFKFDWPKTDEVEFLDKRLLNTEQRDLMPPEANAEGPWFPQCGVLKRRIVPWTPTRSEDLFLGMFLELGGRS